MKNNIIHALMLAEPEEINQGKLWYYNARKICKDIANENKKYIL